MKNSTKALIPLMFWIIISLPFMFLFITIKLAMIGLRIFSEFLMSASDKVGDLAIVTHRFTGKRVVKAHKKYTEALLKEEVEKGKMKYSLNKRIKELK